MRAHVLEMLTPIGDRCARSRRASAGQDAETLQRGQSRSGSCRADLGPFSALTNYQMAHFENWVRGNFDADWPGSPPAPTPFDTDPGRAPGLGAVRSRARSLRRRLILSRASRAPMTSRARRPITPSAICAGNFASTRPIRQASSPKRWPFPGRRTSPIVRIHWWPSQRPDDVLTKAGNQDRWDRGIIGRNKKRPLEHGRLLVAARRCAFRPG